MKTLVQWLNEMMSGRFRIDQELADTVDGILALAMIVLVSVGINWLAQGLYRWMSRHNIRL